jgi:hypothetical protein
MSEKTTVAEWNAQAIEAAHARGMRSAVEGQALTPDRRAFLESMDPDQFEAHLAVVRDEAIRNHHIRRNMGYSAMTGSGVGAGRRSSHGPAYKSQPGSGAYGH